MPRQLENIERSIIEDALRRKQGDVQATATLLGIPKQTLYDKIKRLSVNVDGIREGSTVRSGVLTTTSGHCDGSGRIADKLSARYENEGRQTEAARRGNERSIQSC